MKSAGARFSDRWWQRRSFCLQIRAFAGCATRSSFFAKTGNASPRWSSARRSPSAVAEVDAETIDRVNIYQATRIAMSAAVGRLTLTPDHLLIDAMRLDLECTQTSIIYGDSLLDFDCRCIGDRQGVSRPADVRVRPHVPPVRAGFTQGLQHTAASGGAGEAWTVPAAPQELPPGGADIAAVGQSHPRQSNPR